MSDGSDNDFGISDEEIDAKKHDKLVDDILNLNKIQNVKKPSRTEPTQRITEFNVVTSGTGEKGSLQSNELTNRVKGRKKHEDITNKFRSTESKSKTLPKPLEKPQANLIRRSVNYEKTRLQFDRWEALVASNRAATHLTFPLDSVEKLKIEEKKSEVFPTTWRLKSDLQTELDKLKPQVEEFVIDTEDKQKFSLTLEELKEQRKEAAKLRAHLSYKEAKARRQNKIKSKKYHRILRREKIKQKLKEFEELQKVNPEEALRKLEDIEKARAEERFNLRHKGTGQWAKNKQIRAKYDKESRQALAQQLAISRDLTQKLKPVNSDSEEELEENSKPSNVDESNPWVAGIKPTQEVADFVSGYRQYWIEHNNQVGQNEDNKVNDEKYETRKVNEVFKTTAEPEEVPKSPKMSRSDKKGNKIKKIKKKVKKDMNDSVSTSDWDVSVIQDEDNKTDIDDIFNQLEDKLEQKLKEKYKKLKVGSTNKKNKRKNKKTSNNTVEKKVDLTIPSKSKKHIIDEEMMEQPKSAVEDDQVLGESSNSDLNNLKSILDAVEKQQTSDIDPNKFMQMQKTNLNTAIPDILMTDENEENDQSKVIFEAFEDDDIVADFEKEKAEEIEKDSPKDIDLNLPGWGSWGGGNIDPNKRKRKRFIIKMPPKMPRRDDNKGSLIINEKAQSKIKPHMVSEVPFPFKTVKDYEASIRAPIGNTFVPETAFKRLIEPAVTTKMGAIIEPISKSTLMGRKIE